MHVKKTGQVFLFAHHIKDPTPVMMEWMRELAVFLHFQIWRESVNLEGINRFNTLHVPWKNSEPSATHR